MAGGGDRPALWLSLHTVTLRSLIGSNAAMPLGVVRSVSAEEAESVYATEVRRAGRLNDAGLLMDVGLAADVPGNSPHGYRLRPPAALGMRVHRASALRLQPDLPGAQRLLDVARRGLLVPPLPGQYPVLAGQNEAERVKQLADLAVMTYMRGDMFSYYQHDLAETKVEWEQARTAEWRSIAVSGPCRRLLQREHDTRHGDDAQR